MEKTLKKESKFSSAMKGFWKFYKANKGFAIGFTVMVIIVIWSLLAPWIMPNDPTAQDPMNTLMKPFVDWRYPLGTDYIGRCLLTRLIYGVRTSLLICIVSIPLALIIGVGLGIISGMGYPGKVDTVIMRIVDIQMAYPFTVLVIMLVALLGQKVYSLMIVMALSFWASTAREIRGEVMLEHGMDYISAAKLMGAKPGRIAIKYHWRNIMPGLLPLLPMNIASVIVNESMLSYMGLGVQPPIISIGNVMGDGKNYIATHWWVTAMGGFLIIIMTISLTLIGDALHKHFDPELRH